MQAGSQSTACVLVCEKGARWLLLRICSPQGEHVEPLFISCISVCCANGSEREKVKNLSDDGK